MADVIRIGVIGYGGMGEAHCRSLQAGQVPGLRLTAIADISPARLDLGRSRLGADVATFASSDELIGSGKVDAVLIATPHYDHPPIAIRAFEKKLHVMSEKPAGVHTRQVLEMIAAAKASGRVFGVMFNQRTRPAHQKLRDLVQGGELGEIRRTLYVITDWLRTQIYYDAATWKGTWKGEGGAVLLNQAPHNLDLFQWICGMPKRVRAFCHFGKHHRIETEDDVTAYVEYANGATGVFITSTGDCPGSHLLEIHGDRGKIVYDGDRSIRFHRSTEPVRRFIDTSDEGFGRPEVWKIEVPVSSRAGEEHVGILKDFVRAIATGAPLLAPGEEGIHGVALADAMLMSTWTNDFVEIPFDDDVFHAMLQERIRSSTFRKDAKAPKTFSVGGTF